MEHIRRGARGWWACVPCGMGLVIAGIDEAGYGPMLGPLVVARAVFAIEGWEPGQGAPDLWQVLSRGVCKKPRDARGRVAIADSKKLKRANDTAHPLEHLQAGVLAMLAARGDRAETDAELLGLLGAQAEPHAWYGGEAIALDGAGAGAGVGIAGNLLAGVLADAGVRLLDLSATVIGEATFNRIVKEAGSKSAATGLGVAGHMQWVWDEFAVGASRGLASGGPRVVCDRQGGRTEYGPAIYEWMPLLAQAEREDRGGVTMLEQTPERARYELCVQGPGGDAESEEAGMMHALFQPEGEEAFLPIALASMAAKLTRELLMKRFNRYWCARAEQAGRTLKPTAGYVQDARRWVRDAKGVLTPAEREDLIRLA